MKIEWIKVPESEFITGISDEQREMLHDLIWQHYGSGKLNPKARAALLRLVVKYRSDATFKTADLPPDERVFKQKFDDFDDEDWIYLRSEHLIYRIPSQTRVWLPTFYIARYPITYAQTHQMQQSDPSIRVQYPSNYGYREPGYLEFINDWPAAYHPLDAIRVVNWLGARFPTHLEWEKAARGIEGNLYPWGNSWEPDCCHLANYYSYGNAPRGVTFRTRVSDYPCGVSPYGVWDMVGNVGEYVRSPKYPDGAITVSDHLAVKSDSSHSMSHMDCVAGLSSRIRYMGLDENGHFTGGNGDFGLRPVVDQIPD